ncbi:helix-turn-helix DNA binding domain protein [Microbacterium phage BonaeVitae]|uniref:Helix-turn-helix DNA binding domain protein n=1 Tax=Microbacterium phage BonaeVitae TaxID=2126925 RepID=A0A2R3ZZI8_9CAUD|nr:MerR-like helix-turn-helix DNA binding domain protein [Microbacterium phage BonaeVitae]AVR56175.1 helix-turn-helix DNA binding domain protein [Microbacterium phage BonaeVitae]
MRRHRRAGPRSRIPQSPQPPHERDPSAMPLTAPIPAPTKSRKLTAGQVAELFGVRVETVRRWADAGRLPCTRTLGGDRRFDAAVVQQLLRDAAA